MVKKIFIKDDLSPVKKTILISNKSNIEYLVFFKIKIENKIIPNAERKNPTISSSLKKLTSLPGYGLV